MCLRLMQKLTHVPLAIAIFSCFDVSDDDNDDDVCCVSVFSVTPSKNKSCSAAREAGSLAEVSNQISSRLLAEKCLLNWQ